MPLVRLPIPLQPLPHTHRTMPACLPHAQPPSFPLPPTLGSHAPYPLLGRRSVPAIPTVIHLPVSPQALCLPFLPVTRRLLPPPTFLYLPHLPHAGSGFWLLPCSAIPCLPSLPTWLVLVYTVHYITGGLNAVPARSACAPDCCHWPPLPAPSPTGFWFVYHLAATAICHITTHYRLFTTACHHLIPNTLPAVCTWVVLRVTFLYPCSHLPFTIPTTHCYSRHCTPRCYPPHLTLPHLGADHSKLVAGTTFPPHIPLDLGPTWWDAFLGPSLPTCLQLDKSGGRRGEECGTQSSFNPHTVAAFAVTSASSRCAPHVRMNGIT